MPPHTTKCPPCGLSHVTKNRERARSVTAVGALAQGLPADNDEPATLSGGSVAGRIDGANAEPVAAGAQPAPADLAAEPRCVRPRGRQVAHRTGPAPAVTRVLGTPGLARHAHPAREP